MNTTRRILAATCLTAAVVTTLGTAPAYSASVSSARLRPADVVIDLAYTYEGSIFVTGGVVIPGNMTRAKACKGRVHIVVKAGTKTVLSTWIRVNSQCRYQTIRRVKASKPLVVSVSFPGNDHMLKDKASRKMATKPPFPPHRGD